jgi:YYY domain-containing protein
MIELLQMWALVEGLGVLCLPLTFTVFRNLPDRGWAFSKALGVIVLVFPVWILLMSLQFLPYSRLFILGIAFILVVCSSLAFLKMYREIVYQARLHRAYIALTELVFLGMMLLLGILRSFRPDIHDFEMFMDEGFVSSIMRSTHFPPNDMWYAGHSINYYYYAHYTIATLAKLLGQSASVAFNTGICFFYGLTALNLFGVTCNIVAWARNQQQKLAHRADNSLPRLFAATPYGFISVVLALMLGNLAATQQWWSEHGEVGYSFNWFTPSRVINNTIDEFPAFSFILSCFHAHVLTLAFTILCIGVAFNWFLEPSGKGLALFGTGWQKYLNLCVTAIIVGGLFVMNGWDYPTYMGLVFICILLQQSLAQQPIWRFALLFDCLKIVGSLIPLSLLFYLPFYLHFISPSEGIGLVLPENHTPLGSELLIYGLFIFVFLSLLVGSVLKRPQSYPFLSTPTVLSYEQVTDIDNVPAAQSSLEPVLDRGSHSEKYDDASMRATSVQVCVAEKVAAPLAMRLQRKRLLLLLLVASGTSIFLLGCLAVLTFLPAYTTCLAGLSLALVGVVLLFYHIENRAHAFTLLLGATAFTIIAGCEVFYLKDIFAGGSSQRMNTIFKFYFQAWALLSICGGAGLFFIFEGFRSLQSRPKLMHWLVRGLIGLWGSALLLLVLASMVFPLLSPVARYGRIDSTHPKPYLLNTHTLDGMAYLASCNVPDCDYDTSGDYAALRWLNEHISGDPVIVEANGDDYHYNGRVSVFTGLPTIINWPGHELQWRVNWIDDQKNPHNQQDFNNRGLDITTIYTSLQPAAVLSTMARYQAQYVYVGALERVKYPSVDLTRFGAFMQTVYNQHGVVIYRIKK